MVSLSLAEPTQQEAVRLSGEARFGRALCHTTDEADQMHPIMPEPILGLGQGELGFIATAVKPLGNYAWDSGTTT